LELIRGFRMRMAELGITYATLDEIAGWAERYAGKLLAPEPGRNLGPLSLDCLLGATGLKLALVEDPERLERIRRHRDFVPRKHSPRTVAAGAYVAHRVTRSFLREIGSKGGLATRAKLSDRRRQALARKAARAKNEKLSPAERSASASKASRARWSKPKLVEVKAAP